MIAGGRERSQVEGSGLRLRGAVSGAISGGRERSQEEEISRMRRRSIAVELDAQFSATDTAAMEYFDSKTCSDHLIC